MNHVPRSGAKAPFLKRRCHRCHGSGRAPCQFCSGKGQVATGRDIYDRPKMSTCSCCYGTKTVRCSLCSGEGMH